MDRMFLGVAVDGANEEDEEAKNGLSIWRRRSSACSTGSRPNKKSRSPEEVTSKNELVENIQNKWNTWQKALQDKRKELFRKIGQVMQMARECGADESSPYLWLGVLEIVLSECATKFFMGSDPVGRMAIVKHYARIHECKVLGGSQPRDIHSKSLLKRDAKPDEDSEEEWEQEFIKMFNAAGLSYGCLGSQVDQSSAESDSCDSYQ